MLVAAEIKLPALMLAQRPRLIAVVAEEVKEIVLAHLVNLADRLGVEIGSEQMLNELPPPLGFNPEISEVAEAFRLIQYALDNLAPVLIDGHPRIASIAQAKDEPALGDDDDRLAADLAY